MSALEKSLWQLHRDETTSAVLSAAETGETAWMTDLQSSADSHLRGLHARGVSTVVFMPISPEGRNQAVLEFCSRQRQPPSAPATAALRSITVEIGAAAQRLSGAGTARPAERRRH